MVGVRWEWGSNYKEVLLLVEMVLFHLHCHFLNYEGSKQVIGGV